MSKNAKSAAWSVDTIRNEGEYGSGPDTHSGFDSFAILDSEGRVLFDSLNRDGAVTEITEDGDAYEGYFNAWDAKAKEDAERIVICVNAFEEMSNALEAASSVLRYLPDINTNCGGTRPMMTTRKAEKLVAAALAKAQGDQR